MFFTSTCASPLGELSLACDEQALVGLWFERATFLEATAHAAVHAWPESPVLKLACEWLGAYFAGKRPGIGGLPLAPAGTPFQQLVWKLLLAIPYGKCVTYGDIAQEAAAALHKERMSSRAVGGAVGRNPISIIIPCHRVVGAGGNLTGYGGGIERKIRLLELEDADMGRFTLPRRGKYAVR